MESKYDALYEATTADWERFLDTTVEIPDEFPESPQRPIIEVWTSQMSQWRIARVENIEFLDITVKSGLRAFSPEPNVLWAYKRGEVSPDEYCQFYFARMQASFRLRRNLWDDLKQKQRVAYVCYCKSGDFCHRHLFQRMAKAYLTKAGYDFQYQGELHRLSFTPPAPPTST